MVTTTLNLKRYLLILSVVTIFGGVLSYYIAASSTAFYSAQSYLNSERTVVEAIGPIKSSRLGFDYFITYRGGHGTAELKLVLTGKHKSADAYVKLETTNGDWQIKSCKLVMDDGNTVTLLSDDP